ncbi:MAG: DciA family protein [Candidatus Zapsychrus exili]|nr:DciA family protein [Candidatus Zapsychrus exili]
MDNIKDIIHQVIGDIEQKRPDNENKVEGVWRNILNEKERDSTQIVGVRDGKLLVNVNSAAWLYNLKIRRYRILLRLQEEIPEIKNIIFRIGKVK